MSNCAADAAAPATPPALAPLRQVIRAYGLGADKRLGQNFLLDLNLTRRIAGSARLGAEHTVLEIGPGPGGLTRALLDTPARRIVAVERDRRCVAALQPLVDAAAGRLTVLEGDALTLDAVASASPPAAIVANLPYNIATPLLLRWLPEIRHFTGLTLMVQSEVADRLVADPGSKAYGRLSVIVQWRACVRRVMTVPARAFTPVPKVDAAVVSLTARPDPPAVAQAALERVTAAAFGQRRKMLRQSLRALGDASGLLTAVDLPPTARAEDIDVDGFVALARALAARDGTGA